MNTDTDNTEVQTSADLLLSKGILFFFLGLPISIFLWVLIIKFLLVRIIFLIILLADIKLIFFSNDKNTGG